MSESKEEKRRPSIPQRPILPEFKTRQPSDTPPRVVSQGFLYPNTTSPLHLSRNAPEVDLRLYNAFRPSGKTYYYPSEESGMMIPKYSPVSLARRPASRVSTINIPIPEPISSSRLSNFNVNFIPADGSRFRTPPIEPPISLPSRTPSYIHQVAAPSGKLSNLTYPLIIVSSENGAQYLVEHNNLENLSFIDPETKTLSPIIADEPLVSLFNRGKIYTVQGSSRIPLNLQTIYNLRPNGFLSQMGISDRDYKQYLEWKSGNAEGPALTDKDDKALEIFFEGFQQLMI